MEIRELEVGQLKMMVYQGIKNNYLVDTAAEEGMNHILINFATSL